MKTPLSLFWLGIFCVAVLGPVEAQKKASSVVAPMQRVVQSLTVEDGLPQGLVNGIIQDNQGFIWMSTRDGLVRYDGSQMKVFKNDPADDGTIASNIILSLYLDRDNRLWIIYENHAIDIFNTITHSVRHISERSAMDWLTGTAGPFDITLYEDSRQRYWAVTSDRKKLGYFTLKHLSPTNVSIPHGESVISLVEGEKGKVWIFTDTAIYVIRGNELHKVADMPDRITYNYYRNSHVVQDQQGNWIIGHRGYVDMFNIHNRHWKVIPTPFPHRDTRFLIKAPDGKVYLSAGNQVFRLNEDHSLTLLWTNTHKPGDMQALIVDRSNVIWIGTDTFGARLINLSSRGFQVHPYQYGFIFDVLNQLHFPAGKNAYKQNVVSYLFRSAKDSYGRLWFINLSNPDSITTSPPGYLPIYRLDDQNGPAALIKTDFPAWLQLTFDDQNQCWAILPAIDSSHCWLTKVALSAGTLSIVKRLNHLPNQVSYLTAFHQKLYIVYRKALQRYDPQTGKSAVYKSKDKFGNATLLTAVPDLHNDSVLWITGSGDGLMKFNVMTAGVTAFTKEEGIPDNTVYAAIPDKHGKLWCSSDKGIFRFDPVDHHVLSFTKKDGLQGNEFNRYHFLQTPDGRIFFGGTHGWTSFYPDSIQIDNYQPSTVITGIQVNNKAFTQLPKWKDSVIATMSVLTLSDDQNFLTFSFAGLEFNQAGKLPYRYQLIGIDKGWIDGGTENTAHYTNLPPGDYTFKVNAGNTVGMWSDAIATIKIDILPPWWKTWWAYVLYILFIAAAIYIFYRYRINRLHIQHQMILQQKEAEQLRTMDEMKSRFFSNITHEFRTPLSLIIAPLEQMDKDKGITPVLKKKITIVQRNARQLLRLINQLLDMSKMEAGNMTIFLSRGNLGSFVADTVESFRDQAEIKNIELHLDNKLKQEYNFDADKWQKIVSNLLSNAIKFTPEGGHVHVQLISPDAQPVTHSGQSATDNIFLKIQDSGIGIAKNKLPYIFNRFYQADDSQTRLQGGTGIGLALAKELTELMGGTIEVESPPGLLNGRPTETDGAGKGTLFSVAISVEKAMNTAIPVLKAIKPLPTSDVPVTEPTDMQAITSDETIPSILVVEDNKELNEFIVGMLKSKYRLMTAFNGKEAWQTATEAFPDLILSDIMMPKMDGYALCEKIKQSAVTNHIAVILLSAKASHDSVIKGLGNAADDYIAKPFHPDELLLRIRNILERQQRLRDYYKNQLTHTDGEIDTVTINNPFLSALYEVIETHLNEKDLNVELLAKKMNMHRRTLNRKLEKAAGLSANKVIQQYRLKKAARLLRLGQSVSETAYSVGFESLSYFSTSFKEFYEETPSQYAQSSKNRPLV